MNYKISVPMQRKQIDEFVSFPVRYTVEQENENVTVYHCKVDLPADKIPRWLAPYEFSIRKVYSKPITCTQISHNTDWGSADAVLFADSTADHIRVREPYQNTVIKRH